MGIEVKVKAEQLKSTNKENRNMDMDWALERILKPGSNMEPHFIRLGPVAAKRIDPQVIGRYDKQPMAGHLIHSGIVSRAHCQLEFKNNIWTCQDRKSLNGTWVNGSKLSKGGQIIIKVGDEIGLGIKNWDTHAEEASYMFKLTKIANVPRPVSSNNKVTIEEPSSKKNKGPEAANVEERSQSSSKGDKLKHSEASKVPEIIIDDSDSDGSPHPSPKSKQNQSGASRFSKSSRKPEADSKKYKRIQAFPSSSESEEEQINFQHLDQPSSNSNSIRSPRGEEPPMPRRVDVSETICEPAFPELVDLYQEKEDGNIELYAYAPVNQKTERKLKKSFAESNPTDISTSKTLAMKPQTNNLQVQKLGPYSSKKRNSDEAGFGLSLEEINCLNSKKPRNRAEECTNGFSVSEEDQNDEVMEVECNSVEVSTERDLGQRINCAKKTIITVTDCRGSFNNNMNLPVEQEQHTIIQPSSSVLDRDFNERNTVERVKHKMSLKQPNGTKLLTSPLPKPAKGLRGNLGIPTFYSPRPVPISSKEPPQQLTAEQIKEARRQKLKTLANKDKDHEAPVKKPVTEKAPVKAKPGHSRTWIHEDAQIPGPSRSEPTNGPLKDIMAKMDKQQTGRLSQVHEKPKYAQSSKVAGKVASGNYQSAMLKPAYKVEEKTKPVINSTEIVQHSRESAQAQQNEPVYLRPLYDPGPVPVFVGKNNNVTVVKPSGPINRLPEDKVYRDILSWNVSWLEEQEKLKEPPPVCGSTPLSVNLPDYKDYESYKSVFYPLMLLELWATIYNDYKGKGSKGTMEFRSPGLTTFQASIDMIDTTPICPLLTSSIPTVTEGGYNWHVLTCTVLTDTMFEINRGCDFGSISIDFKTSSGDKENKEYFSFFLDAEGRFDQIDSNTIIPNIFKGKVGKRKFKYTFRVVTKLKNGKDLVIEKGGAYIKKFCYIQSKLRDFKTLSMLPQSKLFNHVLSPKLYAKNEVFNPRERVPPSALIRTVSEKLNPTQQQVVHFISNGINKPDPQIFLLHGPPGTGKTKTIIGLIQQLLKSCKTGSKPKLLVCTPSNTALDEIILRLVSEVGEGYCNFVRIGSSTSEALKSYSLEAKSKAYNQNAGHIASLKESISSMDEKIKEAGKQLNLFKLNPDRNRTKIVALEKETKDYQGKKNKYKEDLDAIQKGKNGSAQSYTKLLEDVDIVFSTLNSCTTSVVKKHFGDLLKKNQQQFKSSLKNQNQKVYLSFTCCIVDEATQTTEPESLAPLTLGIQKLVLCGDPKQLPATVLSIEAESKDYKQSLFHRMFNFYSNLRNQELNPVMMLDIQYRMHPEILVWPNLFFYKGKLKTDNSVLLKCKDIQVKPYLFINVTSQESKMEHGSVSNDTEVKVVQEILTSLHQLRHKKSHKDMSIGIITPYNDQKRKIRKVLQDASRNAPAFEEFVKKIEVDTVDSFQGREKDIMILSCVRTNDLGFLKTPERLNVALTRAKKSQIILGNSLCLTSDTGWKDLMDDATRRGCYLNIPENVVNEVGRKGSLRSWIETNILIN